MLAAVAILSAVSCQKEMAEVHVEGYSFSASIEAETKTVLSESTKVNWAIGDNISVFDENNAAVTFEGQHNAVVAKATFTAPSFTKPETVVAFYPANDEAIFEDETISGLVVSNTQTPAVGSFDANYAIALGEEVAEGSLVFNNVHGLFKFTVNQEGVTSVTVATNGGEYIAGDVTLTTEGTLAVVDNANASATITMSGEFVKGSTYYFVAVPGTYEDGITISYNGEAVKSTTKSVELKKNEILNLGEISKPAAKELKRVWGKYAETADGWIIMGAGNLDRGMAMDDQYIYVSKSTAYAPVIKAFDFEGNEAFDVNVTGMGSANAWGDAMQYSVNCVRTMPKEDGSYVLIACNLKLDVNHVLEIWAWVNGPKAAPTCIGRYAYDAVANASDHRRYGDRFDVKGTWEDGELWFPSMQDDDNGKTIVFKTFTGVDNANRPSKYYRMEPSQSNMKDLAFYPGADEVFSTCNENAKFVKLDGTTHATGWINWAVTADYSETHVRTYGYNFFEMNGKKYIAYVKIDEKNGKKGRLVVIEDGDGTLKGFKEALTANKVAWQFPLQHETEFETESKATTGNTLGNCKVVTVDGVTYIGAHIQGLGCSLFKFE